MKILTILALTIGFALVVGLVLWSGAAEVGAALARVGWGAALVVAARCLAVATAGAGWWFLFPPGHRPAFRLCVLIRFVREATNGLLPLAQIGGDLIGARLMTFWGVEGARAGASVIVDMMLQAGTQFTFTLIGLAVLIALGGDTTVVRVAAVGLAVAAPALIGFYVVQRRAGLDLFKTVLTRIGGTQSWLSLAAIDALAANLRLIYANRPGLALGTLVHLAGWFVGALEVWIALSFMGHPVSYAQALVVESLGQALRGAAFLVPGALGVQEGGMILLAGLFGVPAETGLALALVKRLADLTIGIPGLLAWQAIETRRLIRGRRGRPDMDATVAD